MSRIATTVKLGPYTFKEVVDHPFRDLPPSLWEFAIEGRRPNHEFYNSLDYAMVAAVGEKHTGPHGAGGTGVGTAADWFMKMIGAGS